eukprot:superscaffoldBa00012557_g25696
MRLSSFRVGSEEVWLDGKSLICHSYMIDLPQFRCRWELQWGWNIQCSTPEGPSQHRICKYPSVAIPTIAPHVYGKEAISSVGTSMYLSLSCSQIWSQVSLTILPTVLMPNLKLLAMVVKESPVLRYLQSYK